MVLLFITTQYKKTLAQYKNKLSIQLESFKSSLDEARQDHAFAFARLYEKREAVLLELWKRLIKVRRLSRDATAVKPRCELEDFNNSVTRALEEFESVEFYFPKEFCKDWDDALIRIQDSVMKVLIARKDKTSDWQRDRLEIKNAVDNYVKVWNSTKAPIKTRIQKLIRLQEID